MNKSDMGKIERRKTMEVKVLQLEDFLMAYREIGKGEQPIIFVHGNVASQNWWNQIVNDFAEMYRVYTVDLRGHGQSETPNSGYTIIQYANDLKAFIEKLNLNNVILVGHSMGGAIVMQTAVLTKQNINKVIMVNPAPVNGFFTPEERYPLIAEYTTNKELLSMSLRAVVPTLHDQTIFEELQEDAFRASHAALSNTKSLSSFSIVSELKDWDIPTLLLYGQMDLLVTEAMTDENAKLIPGVIYKKFANVGHSLQVENPNLFISEGLDFLSK